MYQLRTYTINNSKNAQIYFDVHWSKHISSLKKFGIETCAVFRTMSEQDKQQVIAIVKCAAGEDIVSLNDQYMASQEFKDDMRGFDMTAIENVETVDLIKKV
ncbi:hypothetical protein OZX69_01270 [Lactobacillus sp. ESL0731]|uniref:hypothetical protein n=1 Tax=unclassified Lactobacillus TaxID=2620435 RepID=UPI0023F961D8|nr:MULTISPECIES: hypothetical protein [unclassified Lactobacillus]WEV51384.1 hypothetical protein OZX63_01270 [Lactobacillus sp. ESL0700]WEV62514.1 hypothetical protein OZX69_01270 [Lactobacillus sp. ESL0731]